MNRSWLICATILLAIPLSAYAQFSNSAIVDVAYDQSSDGFDISKYCDRELFSKLGERPYQIIKHNGQDQSFELWADSLSRRFIIQIDIPEKGWVTEHPRSIPYLFNRYQKNYLIEAHVRIYRKSASKPLLTKKYFIKIDGKKAYQVCQNNPNDNNLIVPFKDRLLKEKQAHYQLASNLAADLYSIINHRSGEKNVPEG